MTPEESKAIAMRRESRQPQRTLDIGHLVDVERYYPHCCQFHQGFDAALALLKPPRHHEQGVPCWSIEATP